MDRVQLPLESNWYSKLRWGREQMVSECNCHHVLFTGYLGARGTPRARSIRARKQVREASIEEPDYNYGQEYEDVPTQYLQR